MEEKAGASEAQLPGILLQLLNQKQQQHQVREQHQRSMEHQTVQQEMLVRLVEQQREEMVSYRDEMDRLICKGEEIATRPKIPKPTLQKLGDRENIEHFLEKFKRIAQRQE